MTDQNPIPSIWTAATHAWADAFHAIARMWRLALIACLILGLFQIALWEIMARDLLDLSHSSAGAIAAQSVLGVLQAVCMTPFAIAVHRFVLLGEVASGYRLNFRDLRFRRFASNAAQLALLYQAPNLLGTIILHQAPLLGALLVLVLRIVVVIISIRVIILFPAVAVDAARPSWQNAVADVRGHSWRVFVTVFVTSLPLALLAIVLIIPLVASAFAHGGKFQGISTLPIAIAGSILVLLTTTILLALASRLYRALGASLG